MSANTEPAYAIMGATLSSLAIPTALNPLAVDRRRRSTRWAPDRAIASIRT